MATFAVEFVIVCTIPAFVVRASAAWQARRLHQKPRQADARNKSFWTDPSGHVTAALKSVNPAGSYSPCEGVIAKSVGLGILDYLQF